MQRVEREYPGTARWLELTLWKVLESEGLAIEDLVEIYREYPPVIRDLLLYPSRPRDCIFWHRPIRDTEYIVKTIFDYGNLDAATALVGLIRHAELWQDQLLHQEAYWAVITLLERLECEQPLKMVLPTLRLYLIRKFNRVKYTISGMGWTHVFVDHAGKDIYLTILKSRPDNKQLELFRNTAA